MHGVALHVRSQGSWCVFNLQEDFISSSLIVERWRAEHQLQFPSSYRCTLHMYRTQVSQIWQMRGGRKTVTKTNNRKHKARTAKMLGVEPFSVRKTKPSLAADNRSPCHCTSHSAVLDVVLSPALLTCHRSEKIEISCSNSFSGLIFQVLRTQRSSVSITLSVFKQKEQKVALRRWVILCLLKYISPRNQPYIQHGPMCKSAPQTPTGAILWIAPIAKDTNGFRRMKEEGQFHKTLPQIFF